MKKNVTTLGIAAILLIIFLLLLFTFQVRQSEVVVVSTFLKPTDTITNAGPHLKWPWPVQSLNRFDQRVQTFSDIPSETLTADSTMLVVNVFVGWRISDAKAFFPKFPGGSALAAQRQLENMLRGAKAAVIGKHNLSDFVNSNPAQLKFDEIEKEMQAALDADLAKNNYGISIEFLGIKKIGLPENVTQSVFDRMKAERTKFITEAQFKGEAEATNIVSGASRQAADVIFNAQAEATRIQGEAEAEAAKTLGVFQQNPQLAVFELQLEALKSSMNQKSTLIFDERWSPFSLFQNLPANPTGRDDRDHHEVITMTDHDHHDHDHDHSPAPETHDVGSQALSEALNSSFLVVKIAMAALLAVIVFSGGFTVGPQEKAVILRFGKPVGEGQKMLLGAGWHWAFPQPIDEVVRIPITEIQKVNSSIGWYLTTPEAELSGRESPPGLSLNPAIDGYVITADRNIIHTRATVFYHIDDPLEAIFFFADGTNHQFNLAGISNAVQNAANNALVACAARYNVDDVLTRDIGGFQDAVRQRVIDLTEREKLGVVIEQCQVQSIAPRQLKDVFAAVTAARQNRDKLIQNALGEQNRILSQAGANANSITNAAESARVRYVTSIQAEATAFNQLLPRYQSNPQLFEQLEATKALAQVLTNVQDKIFLPQRADGKSRELRLMLNREPPQPKSAANQ